MIDFPRARPQADVHFLKPGKPRPTNGEHARRLLGASAQALCSEKFYHEGRGPWVAGSSAFSAWDDCGFVAIRAPWPGSASYKREVGRGERDHFAVLLEMVRARKSATGQPVPVSLCLQLWDEPSVIWQQIDQVEEAGGEVAMLEVANEWVSTAHREKYPDPLTFHVQLADLFAGLSSLRPSLRDWLAVRWFPHSGKPSFLLPGAPIGANNRQRHEAGLLELGRYIERGGAIGGVATTLKNPGPEGEKGDAYLDGWEQAFTVDMEQFYRDELDRYAEALPGVTVSLCEADLKKGQWAVRNSIMGGCFAMERLIACGRIMADRPGALHSLFVHQPIAPGLSGLIFLDDEGRSHMTLDACAYELARPVLWGDYIPTEFIGPAGFAASAYLTAIGSQMLFVNKTGRALTTNLPRCTVVSYLGSSPWDSWQEDGAPVAPQNTRASAVGAVERSNEFRTSPTIPPYSFGQITF